jgi:hypothetical protein
MKNNQPDCNICKQCEEYQAKVLKLWDDLLRSVTEHRMSLEEYTELQIKHINLLKDYKLLLEKGATDEN